MSLREFVNKNKREDLKEISGYADVVREERYFCAVLYHCMLNDPEGMQRFLQLCGVERKGPARCDVQGVFVEYAMARDLWNCLEENEAKQEYLVSHAALPPGMRELTVEEFNKKLVSGRISPKYIQSPGRWKLDKVRSISTKACKLKWAFNVKPDIVIELDNDTVVCVEAKVESREDKYAKGEDLEIIDILEESEAECSEGFGAQCEVQRFLMDEVLGFKDARMIFLSKTVREKEGQDRKHKDITWSEAYGCFSDMNNRALREAQSRIAYLVGGKGKKGGHR